MLFDPTRHEALQPIAWDEQRVTASEQCYQHVVDDLVLSDDHARNLLFEPGASRGARLEQLDGSVGFRWQMADAHVRRFRSSRALPRALAHRAQ